MRAAVGNCDPRHAHFAHLLFIRLRVEARIGRCYSRHAPETPPVFLHRWHEYVPITRAFGEYPIIRDDLILGLLDFHQLAKLGGLAFPFRMISVYGSKTLTIF